MRLFVETKDDKWDVEHNIVLTLKELQIIHDAILNIPYNDVQKDSSYYAKDILYNSKDFHRLCDEISKLVIKLDGLYDDWEVTE